MYSYSLCGYATKPLDEDSMESRAKKVGYRPVIVVTGSMVPAIEVNSISLMEYCTIDDLKLETY